MRKQFSEPLQFIFSLKNINMQHSSRKHRESFNSSRASRKIQIGSNQDIYCDQTIVGGVALQKVNANQMGNKMHKNIVSIIWRENKYRIGRGSGVLISPNLVLTCAHNMYYLGKRVPDKLFEIYPGLNGVLEKFYKIQQCFIPENYIKYAPSSLILYDYALIKLVQTVPTDDFMHLKPDSKNQQQKLAIYGYPQGAYENIGNGDEFAQQRGLLLENALVEIREDKGQIIHSISTLEGQSGSPIIEVTKNDLFVIGIHKGGIKTKVKGELRDLNAGRLLTKDIVQQLQKQARKMNTEMFTIYNISNSHSFQQLLMIIKQLENKLQEAENKNTKTKEQLNSTRKKYQNEIQQLKISHTTEVENLKKQIKSLQSKPNHGKPNIKQPNLFKNTQSYFMVKTNFTNHDKSIQKPKKSLSISKDRIGSKSNSSKNVSSPQTPQSHKVLKNSFVLANNKTSSHQKPLHKIIEELTIEHIMYHPQTKFIKGYGYDQIYKNLSQINQDDKKTIKYLRLSNTVHFSLTRVKYVPNRSKSCSIQSIFVIRQLQIDDNEGQNQIKIDVNNIPLSRQAFIHLEQTTIYPDCMKIKIQMQLLPQLERKQKTTQRKSMSNQSQTKGNIGYISDKLVVKITAEMTKFIALEGLILRFKHQLTNHPEWIALGRQLISMKKLRKIFVEYDKQFQKDSLTRNFTNYDNPNSNKFEVRSIQWTD